jgi:hypothetical protein
MVKTINLKELEVILIQHCIDMTIIKQDAPIKKIDAILDSIIGAIVRSETSYEDVVECINDVKQDKVIDISLFENGGNIWDYVNEKWHDFAKALWRQRSVGLGTPNAASGEGELMFIFLSPKIEKPTKGDLSINGKYVELKGEGVRVSGKISGKSFREKTLKVCDKFNLLPNKANKTRLDACELEKVQHLDYWTNQMNTYLNESQQKQFVSEWLSCIDGKTHSVENIFNNGFNHNSFLKEIVKSLYGSMVDDRSFDKFVILGDGTDVKIFQGNKDEFNQKVDNDEIILQGDYFRINQTTNIGWYIL